MPSTETIFHRPQSEAERKPASLYHAHTVPTAKSAADFWRLLGAIAAWGQGPPEPRPSAGKRHVTQETCVYEFNRAEGPVAWLKMAVSFCAAVRPVFRRT
jgi:hypothetical protein